MMIIGIIVVGSFLMLCLQMFGFAQVEFPYFSHILASALSAFIGYLFGRSS